MLLRNLTGEEYYYDYYQLTSSPELDSEEETGSDHLPTMDLNNQITCPQTCTTEDLIIQEDHDKILKLIDKSKEMNDILELLIAERTLKCTRERRKSLYEFLGCLHLMQHKSSHPVTYKF